ncbi:sperm microtubule associated protein 1-like [Convolutriloba macropyga]|uniref:sperm microtubule associated protein 1-like n=1 Tax=Convolutriloba macropyga TaxID=536237 RepID=UPI003F526741
MPRREKKEEDEKTKDSQNDSGENGGEKTDREEKTTARRREWPYNYRQQYVPKGLSDEERNTREKGFVLDCIALAQISNDYSKANPKLGPAIPPYNSQKDPSVRRYFEYHDIDKILIGSKQKDPANEDFKGYSIAGKSVDSFHEKGLGFIYLSNRNRSGMGYSQETISGHGAFMSDVKDVPGFNGQFGFRRNTPWLRQFPSVFGTTLPGTRNF